MDSPTLAAQFQRIPEKSVTQVLEASGTLCMVGLDESSQYRLRET